MRSVFTIAAAVVLAVASVVVSHAEDRPWLVVNEDNDHYFYRPASQMNESALRRYIDEMADGGAVTHLFMCPCGQPANYDSKVWDPVWKNLDCPDHYGHTNNNPWAVNAKRLHDAGIEPYAIWIDQCRRRGISPWISMRMNDVHYPNIPNYFRFTSFWRGHPDLLNDPSAAANPTGYWYRCAYNYAKREVRSYHLAMVRELLERYDADGLELDWIRCKQHFPVGAERENAPVLTEFLRTVRTLADRVGASRGRRVQLACRVPSQPQAAELLGMDVEAWAREGLVDVLIPCSQHFSADLTLPYAGWKRRIEAVNGKVRVIPGTDIFTSCNGAAYVQASPEQFRGWADCMMRGGARDFYVFNAPYLWPERRRELYRRGFGDLVAEPRRYPMSFVDCIPVHTMKSGCQLPVDMKVDRRLTLFVGTVPSRGKAELELAFDGEIKKGPKVTVNGTPLASGGRVPSRLGRFGVLKNPAKGPASSTHQAKSAWAYSVPLTSLKSGRNDLTVSALDGTTSRIVWCEARVVPDLSPTVDTNVPGMRKQVLSRPDGEFSFLHDNAIVEHRGKLYVAWYNCPVGEMKGRSVIRGLVSEDKGTSWSGVKTWIEDPTGKWLYVPPAWGSDGTNLVMFVTRMTGPDRVHDCEVFKLNESDGVFGSIGLMGRPFLPNTSAIRLSSGRWIIGGRRSDKPGELPVVPAVAISAARELEGPWRVVDIGGKLLPDSTPYIFPETALRVTGHVVEAYVRGVDSSLGMVRYRSVDDGEHWQDPDPLPFPLSAVKSAAGTLPDGRRFLVANPMLGGRGSLVLYLGGRDTDGYEKAVLLAQGPDSELDAQPEWSYPSACVQGDLLHVVYTSGKRASVLCTIPWKTK